MAGYIIARVKVTDPEKYRDYTAVTPGLIAKYGGRFIVRGGRCETPESPQKDRHVIVEFPDYKAALACYRSDDYQAAAKIRLMHSDSDFMIIEGV